MSDLASMFGSAVRGSKTEPALDWRGRVGNALRYTGNLMSKYADELVPGFTQSMANPKSPREVIEGLIPQDPNRVATNAVNQWRNGDRVGAFTTMAEGMPQTGMILGAGSLTKNTPAMQEAGYRLNRGDSRFPVFRDLGWFEGRDGNPRYRVDDTQAAFSPGVEHELQSSPDWLEGRLSDLFNHSNVFDGYPELAALRTRLRVNPAIPVYGGYFPDSKSFEVSTRALDSGNPNGLRAVLLHEMQHLIQQREGWSPGGDVGSLPAGLNLKTAGENEARFTQFTRDIPTTVMRQSRSHLPWEPLDAPSGLSPALRIYPWAEQIVLPPDPR